jgi:lipopolysaccharide/colanic/teichoic acid biosynthesis glycosyltransferase
LYFEPYKISSPEESPLETGKYSGVKTAVDFLLACALMLAAVPIIAVLAFLVKRASPGPAFYSQMRLGLNGRPFRIWKLRTMVHNCEAVTGPVWSGKNDDRVTPIGRVLRDTHLDELPQLWNVLRGEMSLVGPRPERQEIARRIEARVPGFGLRVLTKPGLTGLAQLRLPPDVDISDVPQKLAQDILYLRQQSLRLDLRILISTAFHFMATGCACASKLMLAGLNPSEQMEMTRAEISNLRSRHTPLHSKSAVEPEPSGVPVELSVAA